MSNNNRPIKKNETINYKKENNSAIPFLNQGMKLFDNIKQKINQEFSRGKREGFENGGILGPNQGMDNKITGDAVITDSKVKAIGNNLAQYSSGRDDLREKTKDYLGTPDLGERNYNLFINALPNPDAREITKCVSKNTLNGLSDDNGRFLTSYPSISTNPNSSNFSDFSKARDACKTWAVDSNEPIFALTRDENSMYNCHVGNNNQADSPIYTKPDFAYNLTGAGSTDANSGGLFANGLIGVYKNVALNTGANTGANTGIIATIKSKRPHNISRKKDNNIWTQSWGNGMPSNINPWWIWDDNNYNKNGHTEYLYYFYTNPNSEMNAILYICVDDQLLNFEVNERNISPIVSRANTYPYHIVIKSGLNIFRFQLNNQGGPGGLLVALTPANSTTPLFISDATDQNWGVSPTRYSYDELKSQVNASNPENTHMFTEYTHNTSDALSKYIRCDKFNGGDINKESITASYGRNCSNLTQKPLMARYVKVKTMREQWLQMSQMAIWGYENGKYTNLAYKCRTNGPGTITVKSFYPYHRRTGNSVWSGHSHLNHLVDGKLKVKPWTQGYLAGAPIKGESHIDDFVLFDLGASYPITKIVYYNRDRHGGHSLGLTINLYNIKPATTARNNQDNGLLTPPIELTGASVQEFNITSNNTSGGESSVDCSSHTEIIPNMPIACRDKLLEDTDNYKIVLGNNGTATCDRYCRGWKGGSWNNEMPDWKGAKCVTGGSWHDRACSFKAGSLTKCICKRDDSLGWAQ